MKRRSFTLLEVLIALVLITTALPLLITPYFYEMVHSSHYRKTIQREEQQATLHAALFEALHFKKLKLSEAQLKEWKQVDPSWVPAGMPKAFYKLDRLKPEKLTEVMPKVELWSITLRWEDDKNEQNPLYIVLEK